MENAPVIKDKRTGSDPGRIVVVSSDVAVCPKSEERKSNPLLPAFKKEMADWSMAERYATTKLLRQLFLTELAQQSYLRGRMCAVGARTFVHAAAVLGEEAHGEYVEDGKIQPMAPIACKPGGLRLAKLLYETLGELSFAAVRDIIGKL
ncbi:hypothetical protein DL765_003602 [Monosporascus sp. GIB2]|nr:hypothetical protein DL765_003602 [Monosporascus sp. GIB2]